MTEYTDYQDLTLVAALECLRRRDETIAHLQLQLKQTAAEMRTCATHALTATEERNLARDVAVTLEQELGAVVDALTRYAHITRELAQKDERNGAIWPVIRESRLRAEIAEGHAIHVLMLTGAANDEGEAAAVLWARPEGEPA